MSGITIMDKSNREITISERKILLIEMLKKLSELFEENNIEWYIGYGTLIGAVRHKGFIPWDDDVDILIPRRDYIRLIRLIEASESSLLKPHMVGITYTTIPKGHYYHRLKIADDRTYTYVDDMQRPGVFVDIFALDAIHEDENIFKAKRIINIYCNLCDLCNSEEIKKSKGIKNVAYRALNTIFSIIGKKRLLSFFERALICKSNDISYGYYMNAVSAYGLKDINRIEYYDETIKLRFEGITVPVPRGYDMILKNLYGEYMKLPPVNQRHGHDGEKIYWF